MPRAQLRRPLRLSALAIGFAVAALAACNKGSDANGSAPASTAAAPATTTKAAASGPCSGPGDYKNEKYGFCVTVPGDVKLLHADEEHGGMIDFVWNVGDASNLETYGNIMITAIEQADPSTSWQLGVIEQDLTKPTNKKIEEVSLPGGKGKFFVYTGKATNNVDWTYVRSATGGNKKHEFECNGGNDPKRKVSIERGKAMCKTLRPL
jgi:hypothetical protein